jgi:nitroimidazol reductase NimA-like FMN-containing flavoprotein (pyridoxamine 5'-phosphate oxidase superfamily)
MRTQRSTVRRLPERGSYDFESLYRVLDEGFLCHLGFVVDGQPFVIPTSYGRDDEKLYVHGSAASRMLRHLAQGHAMTACVTLLDGLVLARSGFHHSMNYRSAVVYGTGRLVEDAEEKMRALLVISEHIVPGRWAEVRGPNAQEMKATAVIRLEVEDFSVKVRSGPPKDEPEDYSLPVWAGVLPLRMTAGEPQADPKMEHAAEVPEYVRKYSRKPGR